MKYTMFSNIVSKLKLFRNYENKVLLGRWAVNDCNKARNIKIDLSNEDHCGSCNQYRLKIIEFQNKKYNNRIIDIETVKY